MPDTTIDAEIRVKADEAQRAAKATGESFTRMGQQSAEASRLSAEAAATAQASIRAQFEDTQVRFASSKNKQIEIDRAWSEALVENAQRTAAAVEESARREEVAARRAEMAEEARAEKLRELGIIALRTARTGEISGLLGAAGEIAGIAAIGATIEHYVSQAKEAAIETEHLALAAGISVVQLTEFEQRG
jgi:hypothetical protein